MPNKWIVKPHLPQESLGVNKHRSLLAQLLYNRGLIDEESINLFLHPSYEKMHSPFLFLDMEKSVKRIWEAIENGEKIVVYGDYDADGVTATAVLVQTFRYLGVVAESYIPDRFSEGYGLNLDAFIELKAKDAKVVISVDCGTNAVDVAAWCKENKIDLIITDHHEIVGKKPDSFALINPKNSDDGYPDDQITGVGVAYKIAKAILSEKSKVIKLKGIADNEYIEHWDKWLLDLVSIGTVADCHSLFGENRIMVKYGLQVLQKTKWLGLRVLLDTAVPRKNGGIFDTYTIGFIIAPRINAAGRLENARIALDLLLSENLEKAQQLTADLEQINIRRQGLTLRLASEAAEQAELLNDKKILLLAKEDWPKGVVGLVAGKIAEQFGKPTIVLERGEEESTGSGRSNGSFNIVDCLKSAQSLLVKFGGHKQAAGLTVKTKDLNALYRALLGYAESHIPSADTDRVLELEAELLPEDINLDVHDQIAELAPFGIGNNKPKFLVSRARLQSKRPVGSEGKHVQMVLEAGDKIIECIGFNLTKICEKFTVGDTIDLAVELIADSWNGIRKVKLRIVDIRAHQIS